MAALEDGVVDTSTQVNTSGGKLSIYGKDIKDSNYDRGNGGYGQISLGRALVLSSNTGIVKAIRPHYHEDFGKDPSLFVDRLYALGLHEPLGLSIPGEGSPSIPSPNDSQKWSRTSLPWMLFGYEISFTPLQILSYYNAIANGGVMVKPQFVSEIRRMGRTVEQRNTEVIHPSICSKPTLEKIQSLLRQVVISGTASNINSDELPMSGKTGTTQRNYWKGADERFYQSSFVGYFPSDAPKYSCIVVIQDPRGSRGYYGSTVAAPVFERIAWATHRLEPQSLETESITSTTITTSASSSNRDYITRALEAHTMPDLRGIRLAEAIQVLENHELSVILEGFSGEVRSQWPRPGEPLPKAGKVKLQAG
jgi:cell division protein FtsI (penicillin-binding protein 3)